jgi:hypothetical protein
MGMGRMKTGMRARVRIMTRLECSVLLLLIYSALSPTMLVTLTNFLLSYRSKEMQKIGKSNE